MDWYCLISFVAFATGGYLLGWWEFRKKPLTLDERAELDAYRNDHDRRLSALDDYERNCG